MSWMSSFAFQKISWWFACRGSRFLFSFHDVLYWRVSGQAISNQATRNRLASIIICLSCRSVKNSFLDFLWIVAFVLFRIIFVRFRETFSLKVRVWVLSEFNRILINFFMVCLERQHLIVFISRGAVPARELQSCIWSSDSKSAGLKSVVYRPSDRVREKNENCARFWGQIVWGKTPIVRELCGIAQSSDLPKNSVVSKSSLRNTLPSSASIVLSSDISWPDFLSLNLLEVYNLDQNLRWCS